MRAILKPAFILHSRPLNETSMLLEVFTEPNGRINLLAKGARSRFRGLLRPFAPLLVSWSGKTELMSLSAAELSGVPFNITGNALFSGIYLNELLVRLLPRFDAYPEIFRAYQQTLVALQNHPQQEYHLRLFEKTLLAELGYGFALDKETINGRAIQSERFYEFIPGRGLSQCKAYDGADGIFSGKCLLALHEGALHEADDLRAAKRLNRIAITALLGEKRLKSRDFFHTAK
jgi:DNA repair protein RecO (recombination protein O)